MVDPKDKNGKTVLVLEYIINFTTRNLFPFGILIFYLIISTNEFSTFPDLLRIHTLKAKEYFNILINTTASIFGIVVAVVLLTFELSRQRLFKRVGGNILTHSLVRNFIMRGILTILLSILSYILIDDFDNGRSITVAYFIGYLFIFFLVFIFPTMKRILYSTSGLRIAMQLIKGLKVENFDSFLDLQTNSVSLLEDEKSALFIIKAELISSVRENDFEAYNPILKGLNYKAKELMGDGANRNLMNNIQVGIVKIWRGGIFEAVRSGTYQFYDSIWDSILTIYINAIDKKHFYLHYQEISFSFLPEFIDFLGRNKLNDNLSSGAKTLSNVCRFSLEHHCPAQKSLSELYTLFRKEGGIYSQNAHHQWEHIIELYDLLFMIQKKAIENSDRTLYESCDLETSLLTTLIYSGEIANLGELQIAYLIIEKESRQIQNVELALRSNLFDRSSNPYRLNKYLLEDAIENEKIYSKRVMTLIGDFIIRCQRQRWLYAIGLLHDWGTLSRLLSKHFATNEVATKAIDYIIKTLSTLKSEIEEGQLPVEAENYLELKQIIKSLKETLQRDNGKAAVSQVNELEKLLSKFQEVVKTKEDIIVSWE